MDGASYGKLVSYASIQHGITAFIYKPLLFTIISPIIIPCQLARLKKARGAYQGHGRVLYIRGFLGMKGVLSIYSRVTHKRGNEINL